MNRLRAMSKAEILWRVSQKRLESSERKSFGKQYIKVTEGVFYQGKEDLTFHAGRLPIQRFAENDLEPLTKAISLLGGFDYEKYRNKWHAGFQTENKWPLIFAYDLSYKQKDEIGDARTNWELNRHFQFALLACNYYKTRDEKYLTELSELFADWNDNNPYLIGISWTSVMEVAIRDINWMYTLGFLVLSGYEGKMLEELCNGIINMTTYVSAHYSRFSSANNHVIVEATAMGIAGIVFGCEEWYEIAYYILRQEIQRQNYADGVNKEVSLHYQSFFMEAVGLLMLVLQHNDLPVPQMWKWKLSNMSRYLSDCQGKHGETIVFGDDDEGKILDLQGIVDSKSLLENGVETVASRNHYHYVLQLMSIVLPERYVNEITDQTMKAILPSQLEKKLMEKPFYQKNESVCYEAGGVSLLKSTDGRALIGFDHGELGFGSIAAHGHADALSFQMYLDGECVLADPGTYIYHMDIESRNWFRKTENHNTVTIDGKNQSEMLGAFMWGKRANATLVSHNLPVGNANMQAEIPQTEISQTEPQTDIVTADVAIKKVADTNGEWQYIEAEQDGYAPVIHRRKLEFNGSNCLKIHDTLTGGQNEQKYEIHFMITSAFSDHIKMLEVKTADGKELEAAKQQAFCSVKYGKKSEIMKLSYGGLLEANTEIISTIKW